MNHFNLTIDNKKQSYDTYPINGKDMPVGAAPWQDMTVSVLGFLSVLILVSAVLIILSARNKATK